MAVATRDNAALQASAARLDVACCQAGLSTAEVARIWGVRESYVRRVRAGETTVAQWRIDMLPKRFHEAAHRLRTGGVDEREQLKAKTRELAQLLGLRVVVSFGPNLDGDTRRAVLVSVLTAAATTAVTELVKWAHEELKQRVSRRERDLERRVAAIGEMGRNA